MGAGSIDPAIDLATLAKLRPGMPVATLRSALGNHWVPLRNEDAGYFWGRNLNIPFNELKARMTGPNAMSLGQAVHVLRPNTPERQARQEAKLAEKQAKETEKAKPIS